MPAPYSCFSVSLPLKFGLIDSPDLINDPIVAVKSFVAFPDVLNFNPHVKSQVQLGDILVSVNGMSFHQWYLDNKHMTGGANQFGGMRQMLNYLSARNGKLIPLPTDDDVTYELKRFLNSTETYQITVKVGKKRRRRLKRVI